MKSLAADEEPSSSHEPHQPENSCTLRPERRFAELEDVGQHLQLTALSHSGKQGLHGIKMARPMTTLSRWLSSSLVCINILIRALILPLSLQSVVKLRFPQRIIHDVYS